MKHSSASKYYLVIALALVACIGTTLWWLDRPGPSFLLHRADREATPDIAQTGTEPSPAPVAVDREPSTPLGATNRAIAPRTPLFRLAGSVTGAALEVRGIRPDGPSQNGRTAAVDLAGLSATLARLRQGDAVSLPLPDGTTRDGVVNLAQHEDAGWVRIGGALADGGSFSLGASNKDAGGVIQYPKEHRAYQLQMQNDGRLLLIERRLGDVVCDAIPRRRDLPALSPSLTPMAVIPPVLDTRPTATAVLYLDFDGATVTDSSWNNGTTITAAAARLTAAQMTEVVNRVKEDYWAFNISITTDVNRYSNAPVRSRMRCIITANDTAAPGAGGVAYVDSFSQAGRTYSSTIPCWVFEDTDAKTCADAVAHELGHTLGLNHDGRTSPAEEYYEGQGTGATGWAPIMGVGYYKQLVQWSKGEYANANNTEDDIAIIAGTTNGFGFVADAAGNTISAATPLTAPGGVINQVGIMSQQTDADVYSFTTTGGTVTVNANPATIDPNVDILLELLNPSGTVLASNNPTGALNAAVTQTLAAGTYYVRVRGTGEGDPRVTGYSAYGCIGAYTLTGTISGGGGGTSTVATPVFTPGTGTYTGPVSVSISTATTGATIRYTTDGSDPTATSTIYAAPISVTANTTVKARASLSGMTDSAVATATYTISTTGGVTVLTNAVPVTGIAGASASDAFYKITVPAGQSALKVQTSGGTGDADLYVKFGSQPTTTSYGYASTGTTTAETINVTNPAAGDYYVLVHGYSTFSGVTLTATCSAPTGTVAMPTFSPGSGTYTTSVNVSISTATSGATIRYTTNGTDPTSTSTIYNAPLTLTASTTLKARAFLTGLTDSAVATATYTIGSNGGVTTLSNGVPLSGLAGTAGSQTFFKITVPTGQATLVIQSSGGTGDCDLYVKAGTQPTTSSYSFSSSGSTTAETITVANPAAGDWYILAQGYTAYSGVTLTATYTAAVGTVATPTISPGTGTYTSSVTATITTATSGATIRYTTNGTDPTSSSAIYSGALSFTSNATLKARGFKTGMNDSAVSTATYTITTGSTVTVLANAVPVTGLSGALNSERVFKITVPTGQSLLAVQTSGGTGDCDLYVKLGVQPTTAVYDYRGYTTGTAESVSVANPAAGDWYVMVKGYTAFGGVTLVATYTGNTTLTNAVPVTGIAGALSSQKIYKITVPAGRPSLVIKTYGGTGDADLYVRAGSAPTLTTYNGRSTGSTTTETVTITNPAAGDWYIMIYGYTAYSGMTLVGSY